MNKPWPKVKLGEVLTPVRRFEDRVEVTEYPFAGTYSFARGIFVGERKLGSTFSLSKVQRIREGDFVYCKIMAWEGAFGIVPKVADNCVMSGAFVAYEPNTDRIDHKFLDYFFKVPDYWRSIGSQSTGTNVRRRSLHPRQFEKAEIPLPPLAEQRRIVARIEELAAKITEARSLRQQAVEEAEALHFSVLHQYFISEASTWMPMAMNDAIEINNKLIDPTVQQFSQLPHISGENIEKGTCRLLPWRTAEADAVKSKNYHFGPNTILYSKIRPYLRKAVLVDFSGVCSADIYPIQVKSPKLEPHFIKWVLVAEPFTEYANRLSGRTRMPKLNRKQLFGFAFSHPPLPEQRRIVAELDALQEKVDALKRLQAETAAGLDALLPSILDRAFKGEL